MDFMKVFDQTVREIKREVNLKVLKVPEIEQKVLDATDDEPWGPHGTVLAEIADATKRFTDCQIVMNVLWTRLTETDKNWRLVYKALTVIEYLVGHGSERAVDDIIEHTFQISSLASFEYVEPSGKDLGINVRKKAETIVGLLNDKDKIQEVRNKAAANREKYFGLSSSGITYKSGAASFSSSNFGSSDRYGGFGSTGGSSSFRNTYKDNDRSEDKNEITNNSKKEPARYGSKKQGSSVAAASKASTKSKPDKHGLASSQNSSSDKYSEDFDDFDPRGTSTAKPSSGGNQVDLFGQSIVGDLLDAPVSTPTDTISKLGNNSEVDLFADAAFVSATPAPESSKVTAPQANINLFDSAPAPTVSTTMDFFASPDTLPQPNSNPTSQPDTTSNAIDPFASVPLNNFEGSDPFGAFTSNANPIPSESGKGYSNEGNGGNVNASSPLETKSPPKKESFQVKSGIWADSLSRGLIDLNITAPKKVNLADVGIVGGLTDGSEEKGPLPSFYMGGSMRVGSGGGSVAVGSGKSGFASTTTDDDDFFSSLSNPKNQSGSFQK